MDLIAGYSLPNGLLSPEMGYKTRNRAGQLVQPSTDTITNAITQGLLPMLASAGVGTGAGIAGQFGDAETLGRLAINKLGGNVNPNATLPTQEGILAYLNSITPLKPYTDNTYTKIGANLLAPILDPTALITTARASKPVAKAIGEHAYNKTEDMMRQQGLMPNIVPRDVVNEMGMATTLPKNTIFEEAVKNTPSARLSDEGLHINVMRKQKPEQSMTESVRSGVFYLPEGSTNIKHYGGSNSYGGTEKINGETLYKNPLFVKGSTGGKAPEAAYQELTSKADLKQLQDDVFKAITGPNNIRAELVQQFLDTHAPDLSDYTHYIIDNSRKGNQLRYALQEAAVAQKVRDAGYDAVIGHSKGKSGPFISEIFDVRESHYPNQYGDYQLNPKFEEMYQNTPNLNER
jgi:hypothetical protein